jgi:hypothetical protein
VAATLSIVHKGELHTLSLGTLPDSVRIDKRCLHCLNSFEETAS